MRGFKIGRLFGIDLRVDWSWVFIFVLLTWSLTAVFSSWHPDWMPGGAALVAMTASLIFFACIVVHELAHSLVARSYGVRVRSITLFLFGGISNIEREPPSAGAEFFTAIVGPLTSTLLGVLFLVVASAVTSVSMRGGGDTWTSLARLGPFSTLLVWLGPVNIMIGLFNMLPAFPLDGGRVLRSVLWSVTEDLRAATRWASGIGQVIGWLLIGCGIAMSFGLYLPFFGTGLVNGLWIAFIGWFLSGAAAQANTRLALDDMLAGMTVEQLMRRDAPAVGPELPVAALVHQFLVPGDDRAVPVVRDGRLVGLVSTADVRGLSPDQWATTPVASIMRGMEEVVVAEPEQPLAEAFERLAQRDIELMPVVVDGALVGMLRRRDVTRWLELAWKPTAGAPAIRPASGGSRDVRERHDTISMPKGGAHHTA